MKAAIDGFDGSVEFDPMDYDHNEYWVYVVAVCDPETEEITEEERYTDKDSFESALKNVFGRDYRSTTFEDGYVDVIAGGAQYECPAHYEIAYVVDTE